MHNDILFYTAITLALIALLLVVPFILIYIKIGIKRNHNPAFCDLLDYATLIEPNLIVLKSGALCSYYRFFPDDLKQLDQNKLLHIQDIIGKAFLKLGGNWAVHIDIKRIKDGFYAPVCASTNPIVNLLDKLRAQKFTQDKSFNSVYYLTLTYQGTSISRRKLANLVIKDNQYKQNHYAQTYDLIEQFKNDCKSIIDTISLVVNITPLKNKSHFNFTVNETLSYIYSCISGKDQPLILPQHNCYLDALLSTQDFVSGFTPKIGNKHIACIALDAFPPESYFGILNNLAVLPFAYRFNSRYLSFDKLSSNIMLEKYRRLWTQKSRGMLAQIFNQQSTRVNEYAIKKVSEIDEAKFAFEGNEEIFGSYTANIVVMDEDEERLQNNVTKALGVIENLGFGARVETVNTTESYLGSLPGHCFENIRRPIISSSVFADLLPLSSPWSGERYSPNPLYGIKSSPLMQVKSLGESRFYLNLHQKDLGNTAVVGPPGSGKSVLLGALILNLLRYKNMKIYAFDKGYSFYALSKALSGTHIEFSNLKSAFCPLQDLEGGNDFDYAQNYIEMLCRLSGYEISIEDRVQINDCLKLLAQRSKDERSLSDLHLLLLSKNLKQALAPYTLITNHESLLDGTSNLGFSTDLTVFECSSLFDASKRFSIPVLKQVFRLIDKDMNGQPRAIVLDEAWLMLQDEVFAKELLKWFKTLRKHNVIVILATQSLTDIAGSSLFEAFLECVKTRIFLPNYDAKSQILSQIYKQFSLNEEQLNLLSTAIPKKDYLLQKGAKASFFELVMSDCELKLLSFSGDHIKAQVDELFKRYGNEFFKYKE